MKYLLLIGLFALRVDCNLIAQNEYNEWHFGKHAGLNFNTNPISEVIGSRICSFQSSSSICDSSGKLLFYSNGETIYNSRHEIIKGWVPYKKNSLITSSSQGNIFLPYPNNKYLYYQILGVPSENQHNLKDSMIMYQIIDSRGDNGLGEVVRTYTNLMPGRIENMAFAKHSNGFDYWVLSCDFISNSINLIRTEDGQFQSNFKSVPVKKKQIYYEVKFSPDSRTLFSQRTNDTINGVVMYIINLYKFNPENGQLERHIQIPTRFRSGSIRNLEFSPDSRYVYFQAFTTLSDLYQMDLKIWDSAIIQQSIKSIASLPVGMSASGMQLGPDKRIYVFYQNFQNSVNMPISTIYFPEKSYQNCDFVYESINLKYGQNYLGGPYYPSFWFRDHSINSGKYSNVSICRGDSVELKCNVGISDRVSWNNGDTGSRIFAKTAGNYIVKITHADGSETYDDILVKYKTGSSNFLGNDTVLCNGSIQISANLKGTYLWSDSETIPKITITDTGTYWVKVNSDNCTSRDTLLIGPCPDLKLFIPNCISPDDNGINDDFTIVSNDKYLQLEIEIFNQWGEIIFISKGNAVNWDGRYKSAICPNGIYYYLLKYKSSFGGSYVIRKGYIELIR